MSKEKLKLKNILKHEGLRYTSQREAIWNELRSSREHRDAEAIYLALRQSNIEVSRATVYRTIDVLVKNKLVRKLDVGIGPSKFEYKSDSSHHDHIICIQCGKIDEFLENSIEELQDKIAAEYGYKLVRHIHQLFGICRNCE